MPAPQGILDFILLAFIGWGALTGLRAGLALALTSLLGLLTGWLAAGALTGRALAAVDQRWHVLDRLAGGLRQRLPLPDHVLGAGDAGGALGRLAAWVQDLPLPQAYRDLLAVQLQAAPAAAPEATADLLYRLLAGGLAAALTFLALLILTRLAFALLGRLLHGLMDMGPLLPLNRLAGAVFGALRNLAVAALALGVLAPTAVLAGFGWVGAAVESSAYAPILLQIFYRISPWVFGLPPAAGG